MTRCLCLLVSLGLLRTPLAAAGTGQPAPAPAARPAEQEVAAPLACLRRLDRQAGQLTGTLTDALHLSRRQQAAVRLIIRENLLQQAFADEQPATQPDSYGPLSCHDQRLLRVLTAGQYVAFRGLEESQPLSSRLISSTARVR